MQLQSLQLPQEQGRWPRSYWAWPCLATGLSIGRGYCEYEAERVSRHLQSNQSWFGGEHGEGEAAWKSLRVGRARSAAE